MEAIVRIEREPHHRWKRRYLYHILVNGARMASNLTSMRQALKMQETYRAIQRKRAR